MIPFKLHTVQLFPNTVSSKDVIIDKIVFTKPIALKLFIISSAT